jgi:hypothetical protein
MADTISNDVLIGTASLSLLKNLSADSMDNKHVVKLDLLSGDSIIGAVSVLVYQYSKSERMCFFFNCE